ncbi:MAG: cation-transporting P-type ATPase [Gammaproteobacteria bacterium]|nr:cation-transporting P-type ATPase [Gammaproteobacteria bacterium]
MPQGNTTSSLPPQPQSPNWHALTDEEVVARLESSFDGLSQKSASERLHKYGFNQLSERKQRSALWRFLIQFHNVLIYILLATGFITLALSHYVDSAVIFMVVVINALIGFIQEGKAERALDAIKAMLSHRANVYRDGVIRSIPAEELVPGDVVTLASGDRVPADLRLFKVRELRVDEAILTGESAPAATQTERLDAATPIADRLNIAYSGTFVTYGQGQGMVIATGDQSELGRISGMLQEITTLTTPLLRQMSRFGTTLSIVITVVAAVTFAFGLLVQDYSATEMFLATVGLVVAAIPEGLPAIMTITLAIGVQKMARRNAIIRRLPAVETLGSVSIICSDKTGTLTRNEMTAVSVLTDEGRFTISGNGYDPHGVFRLNDVKLESCDSYPALYELCRAVLLCNDSGLAKDEGRYQVRGDPTEAALIVMAMKAGLDGDYQQQASPRTDVIPFESEHKFMATLHHDHAGHNFIYLKGAPEVVMGMCRYQRQEGDDVLLDKEYWLSGMEAQAEAGQRLLAVAYLYVGGDHHTLNFDDVKDGLSLLGVVGIMDPPRQEAKAAIAACRSAGIGVKMITGDHATTARVIAEALGLDTREGVVVGAEIGRADEQALQRLVAQKNVFARTSPEHKLRLVNALQANGDVVVMTGDGVNDAPALKRADVGVAMGVKGTEVAREASEMVLTDDNFTSIVDAVREGRTVYDNLKKSIMFILPTNGGEALTILAAIMFGRMLPITAVQILWVNMITAVTLALTLAFEPAELNIMRRAPRRRDEPLLSPLLIWRIVFVSLILVSGTFGMFLWQRMNEVGIDEARTVAVNTLVMFEIFYLFSARHFIAPSLTREGLAGNRYALIASGALILIQLAFTYAPPFQLLFQTTPLSLVTWLEIVAVASSVLFLVELEKWWLRWRSGEN